MSPSEDHPPADWTWCPPEIFRAFRRNEGFRGLPFGVIKEAIIGVNHERLCRMLMDNRIGIIANKLSKAILKRGVTRASAITHLITCAALSSEHFMNPNWDDDERKFARTAKLTRQLLGEIAQLDHVALEAKAFHHLNPPGEAKASDKPGVKVLVSERLFEVLIPHLELFVEYCELPVPPKSALAPRKLRASDERDRLTLRDGREVSRHALALTKAAMLKREFDTVFPGRHYQVIADLVTLADDLAEPLTAEAVRRA